MRISRRLRASLLPLPALLGLMREGNTPGSRFRGPIARQRDRSATPTMTSSPWRTALIEAAPERSCGHRLAAPQQIHWQSERRRSCRCVGDWVTDRGDAAQDHGGDAGQFLPVLTSRASRQARCTGAKRRRRRLAVGVFVHAAAAANCGAHSCHAGSADTRPNQALMLA